MRLPFPERSVKAIHQFLCSAQGCCIKDKLARMLSLQDAYAICSKIGINPDGPYDCCKGEVIRQSIECLGYELDADIDFDPILLSPQSLSRDNCLRAMEIISRTVHIDDCVQKEEAIKLASCERCPRIVQGACCNRCELPRYS